MLSIYFTFFFILILYFWWEFISLKKSVREIPIRILVNGTRGKTTTVRILYNILISNGYTAFAKTTGDQPIEYSKSGGIKKIKRIGPVSIIENIKILKKWAKHNPQAIIMECMALHPENQRVLSEKILNPTHIALANVLRDHQEAMGVDLKSMHNTVQESLTKEAIKILPESFKDTIKHDDQTIFYDEIKSEIKYKNIPQPILDKNWSLINTMGKILKVDKQLLKSCFDEEWRCIDGKIRSINKNKNFEFWNLFSVNDIDSFHQFVEHIKNQYSDSNNLLLIFNTRSDRPLRTKSFITLLIEHFSTAQIIITGSGRRLAKRLFAKISDRMNYTTNISELTKQFNNGFDKYNIVIGVGNHLGVDKIMETLGLSKTGDIS